MKINPIYSCSFAPKKINLKQNSAINFGSNMIEAEKYIAPKIVSLNGDIDESSAKKIVSMLTPENILSDGAHKKVYSVQGAIAKVDQPTSVKNFVTTEHFALNKLYGLEKDSSPCARPLGLISIVDKNSDKRTFISVQESIDSQPIRYRKEAYTAGIFNKLMHTFFNMDKEGLINYGNTPNNIALTNSNEVKILNLGNMDIIDNSGNILKTSEKKSFSIALPHYASAPCEERFLGIFKKSNLMNNNLRAHLINRHDNPYMPMYSNVSVYETECLHPFLTGKECENPLETFRLYIKAKANEYHTKMANFMGQESLLKEVENQRENVKTTYKQALSFEQVLQRLLSNPSDEVLKIEALKLQFKKTLAEDNGEYKKEVMLAYENLRNALKEIDVTINSDLKEYVEGNLEYIDRVHRLAFNSLNSNGARIENNLFDALFKTSVNDENVVKISTASDIKKGIQGAQEKSKEAVTSFGSNIQKQVVQSSKNGTAEISASAKNIIKKYKTPIAFIGMFALGGIALAFNKFITTISPEVNGENQNENNDIRLNTISSTSEKQTFSAFI